MPPPVTLAHAVAYSAVFCLYAVTTLQLSPRLWLRHYPAVERARQPPRSRQERRALAVHGTIFVGGMS